MEYTIVSENALNLTIECVNDMIKEWRELSWGVSCIHSINPYGKPSGTWYFQAMTREKK